MRRAAFTLVELVLVMALLVILLAMVAPVLSNSLRGRGLSEEATRFVSLTEFARSEAVSQGVPTLVWVDSGSARYGFDVRAGYESVARADRTRSYAAPAETRIEVPKGILAGSRIEAAAYAPNGTLALDSAESVRFIDRFGAVVTVARMADGWGYEIARAAR